MDLGFLLSGTNDKGEIFTKQRDAVIEIIRRIPVSSRNNKVGYVMSNTIQLLRSDESAIIRNLQIADPSKGSDIKQTFEKSIELFQEKNGARDGMQKVLVAFVNDIVLNYDASNIIPALQKLINQGIKVILLQPPNSLSLNLLPADITQNIQRDEVDLNEIKSILDKLLTQLNEGKTF